MVSIEDNSLLKEVDIMCMHYSNLLKRINVRKKFSDFIMVYYSVVLIIYSISNISYEEYFDGKLLTYMSLIISILLLVYSLINSSENFSKRVRDAEYTERNLRKLKRELINSEVKDIENYKNEFNKFMLISEKIEDIDIFRTLKQQAKLNGIDIWRCNKGAYGKNESNIDNNSDKYFDFWTIKCNINIYLQLAKIFMEYFLYAVLVIAPIIIIIICYKNS